MKLTSDTPFWLARNGLGTAYPFLDRDLRCDIAIVGAGVTAAIIAHELAKLGRETVMLDSRDVCTGSTSASTALLQYEMDVSLVEMAKTIGKTNAQRAYQLSHASIDVLERIETTPFWSIIEHTDRKAPFTERNSVTVSRSL